MAFDAVLRRTHSVIETMSFILRWGLFKIFISPAKRSFSGVYGFQHVGDSEIPSTFKVFSLYL